jgi:hypothetical protein
VAAATAIPASAAVVRRRVGGRTSPPGITPDPDPRASELWLWERDIPCTQGQDTSWWNPEGSAILTL